MIFSFQQLKGGAGKTTLALNVAAVLAKDKGARVLFVDADPQGSALDWSQARDGERLFQVIGLPRPKFHVEVAPMVGDYDHIILDTPPRNEGAAKSALMLADVAILPTTPSQLDVWALAQTTDLVKEAQAFKPDLRACIVINRKVTGSVIGKATTEGLKGLEFPVLETAISHRVAFAEMAGLGQSVIETDPRGAAAGEVRALTDEILKYLED